MINILPPHSIDAILILYLIICANFMVPLVSCDLQAIITDNIIVRHIIGLFTMIFFVRLNGPEKSSFKNIIIDSIILYLWFIATTRITSEILYIIIPLAAIYFIIYIYETTLTSENNKDKKLGKNIESAKFWISRLLGVLIIIGVILYYGEKRLEYGSNFNIISFIFGKLSCKKYTPNYTMLNKLAAIL
jgi:hypothetical protein